KCTLAAAIEEANATAAVDDIRFAVTGRIELTSILPPIRTPMRIFGPGASFLTVDENGHGQTTRIGSDPPTPPSDVWIVGLTFTGGNAGTANGGAFLVGRAVLRVDDCVLVLNRGGDGGAVMVDAPEALLLLAETTVAKNSAARSGGGIALFRGALRVERSTFV